MGDSMKHTAQQPDNDSDASLPGVANKGFTRKNLILIVGAVLLFFVVAGAATYFVLDFLQTRAQEVLDTGDINIEQPQETSPTPDPEVIVEPPSIPTSELFTFRDIFVSVIKPVRPGTPGAGVDATRVVEPDVLYLLNIVVEDGVRKAVLELNRTTHTLAEGEVIPGTPWMVRSIGDRTAVVAFGDAPITLSIGHGAIADPSEPGVITPVAK